MFATTTQVFNLTSANVNESLISRAQSIIEVYVGRLEEYVTNDDDLEYLKRAVAYQAAYMLNNEDIVFEQIAASTISQNDSVVTFKSGDQNSPWIAPLAIMACKRLSFLKTRFIRTGKIDPVTLLSDTIESDWTSI
jgi:hypothetical protein